MLVTNELSGNFFVFPITREYILGHPLPLSVPPRYHREKSPAEIELAIAITGNPHPYGLTGWDLETVGDTLVMLRHHARRRISPLRSGDFLDRFKTVNHFSLYLNLRREWTGKSEEEFTSRLSPDAPGFCRAVDIFTRKNYPGPEEATIAKKRIYHNPPLSRYYYPDFVSFLLDHRLNPAFWEKYDGWANWPKHPKIFAGKNSLAGFFKGQMRNWLYHKVKDPNLIAAYQAEYCGQTERLLEEFPPCPLPEKAKPGKPLVPRAFYQFGTGEITRFDSSLERLSVITWYLSQNGEKFDPRRLHVPSYENRGFKTDFLLSDIPGRAVCWEIHPPHHAYDRNLTEAIERKRRQTYRPELEGGTLCFTTDIDGTHEVIKFLAKHCPELGIRVPTPADFRLLKERAAELAADFDRKHPMLDPRR